VLVLGHYLRPAWRYSLQDPPTHRRGLATYCEEFSPDLARSGRLLH
jgi:hypothetical protein